MPIDKRMTHGHLVGELMDAYNKTGKIGNTTPKNKKHALKIANAISYDVKEDMSIKEIVEEFEKMENIENAAKVLSAKQEGFLPTYEVVGTIIEEKGTYNIMDAEGHKLLNKNYPSLKKMLNDLADNM